MPEKILECVECGAKFSWSEGEQRFYANRRLHQPKRCQTCRAPKGAKSSGPFAVRRHVGMRPTTPYGLAAAGLVVVGTLATWWMLPSAPAIALLLSMSLVTFLVYGYDKLVSGSSLDRVPELVLLGLAAAGGTLGALAAMVLFRHKTRKASFRGRLRVIVALQTIILVVYAVLTARAPRGWA